MGDHEQLVRVAIGNAHLEGNLAVSDEAQGIVLFVHGSGSSRHSPRNRYVAQLLRRAGLATLLIDLLTEEEEEFDLRTRRLRFDIALLTDRVESATDWLTSFRLTERLRIGYFGASTGAAAALAAAANYGELIGAVVSRGGRPDLAGAALPLVLAPTLLIVGGADVPVLELNEEAFEDLTSTREKRLEVVPGASHLFEEPGALEQVGALAADWFQHYLLPLPAGS